MKFKRTLPVFKKKFFKRYCHQRKTNINVIGKEKVGKSSGSLHGYFKRSFKHQRLLLSKFKRQLRCNLLIDKRIGQNFLDLSEEEQILNRYSFNLQRKYPNSQLNIFSEYDISTSIGKQKFQSEVSDSTLTYSENSLSHSRIILNLKHRSINAESSLFRESPLLNANPETFLLDLVKEVETQWQVVKYFVNTESDNYIHSYSNSFNAILGELMFEERTFPNRYSRNFEMTLSSVAKKSIVVQEFSPEFDPYNVNVAGKDENQDNSGIKNPEYLKSDFSEKLADIQSTHEYQILVQNYIASLLSIDCRMLMENVFFLCDQLIESMFINRFILSRNFRYIDCVSSSFYQVLILHSKFVMKYFLIHVKSVRNFVLFRKHSIKCEKDMHKSVMVLYFLLSLLDVDTIANLQMIKFGLTVSIEILSAHYFKYNSDAGFLLLLVDAIIKIGSNLKRYVPEVFTFLTSFVSLYSESSDTICHPLYSNSTNYAYLSEFRVNQLEFSKDLTTDLNFLFNDIVDDRNSVILILILNLLCLVQKYMVTYIEPFSHISILLPLVVNLTHLRQRSELPICLMYLIDRLLLLINNNFENIQVKAEILKGRTNSLRFLNLEEPHSARIIKRVYPDHTKQSPNYYRHQKSQMMRIRRDNSLLSYCQLGKQLFNDKTRRDKVDGIHKNIIEDKILFHNSC